MSNDQVFTADFDRLKYSLRLYIGLTWQGMSRAQYVFPQVITMSTIRTLGYNQFFPDLLGQVLLDADDAGAEPLALTPAACHHLYPLLRKQSRGGQDVSGGYEVLAPCFRNEAGTDAGRMKSFTMLELVSVGEASDVDIQSIAAWAALRSAMERLGLKSRTMPATDPFFGPIGRVLKAQQASGNVKEELCAAIAGGGDRVAIASINRAGSGICHKFDLTGPDGTPLTSCCVAVGLERLALAVLTGLKTSPAHATERVLHLSKAERIE